MGDGSSSILAQPPIGDGGGIGDGSSSILAQPPIGDGGGSGDGAVTIVPVVTPGASCAAAALVSLNTNYTFSLAAGSHWFYFNATNGTRYKGTFTINSGGNFPSFVGSQGNCPTPINMIFSRSTTGCSDGLAVATNKFFIQVQNVGPPTLNYTFRLGTGSCP
jgi:hypothetical protein